VGEGKGLDLGDGIVLSVLHPSLDQNQYVGDDNNGSVVLRIDWGESSFLLTGDTEAQAERALLRSGTDLEVDVLRWLTTGATGPLQPSSWKLWARAML
jgi:competence protein ComEC